MSLINTHLNYLPQMERDNPLTRILQLIERHAPRMMREGGGSLTQPSNHCVEVEDGEIAEMNNMVRRGASIDEIASHFSVHYTTVCRFTRETRHAMGKRRADSRRYAAK